MDCDRLTLPRDGPATAVEREVFFECIYQRDVGAWIKTIASRFLALTTARLYFDSDVVNEVVVKHFTILATPGCMSLIEAMHFFSVGKLGNRSAIIRDVINNSVPVQPRRDDYLTSRLKHMKGSEADAMLFKRAFAVHRFVPEGSSVYQIVRQFFTEAEYAIMKLMIERVGFILEHKEWGMNTFVTIHGMEPWAEEYRLHKLK